MQMAAERDAALEQARQWEAVARDFDSQNSLAPPTDRGLATQPDDLEESIELLREAARGPLSRSTDWWFPIKWLSIIFGATAVVVFAIHSYSETERDQYAEMAKANAEFDEAVFQLRRKMAEIEHEAYMARRKLEDRDHELAMEIRDDHHYEDKPAEAIAPAIQTPVAECYRSDGEQDMDCLRHNAVKNIDAARALIRKEIRSILRNRQSQGQTQGQQSNGSFGYGVPMSNNASSQVDVRSGRRDTNVRHSGSNGTASGGELSGGVLSVRENVLQPVPDSVIADEVPELQRKGRIE